MNVDDPSGGATESRFPKAMEKIALLDSEGSIDVAGIEFNRRDQAAVGKGRGKLRANQILGQFNLNVVLKFADLNRSVKGWFENNPHMIREVADPYLDLIFLQSLHSITLLRELGEAAVRYQGKDLGEEVFAHIPMIRFSPPGG